jgi:hypothetical protein
MIITDDDVLKFSSQYRRHERENAVLHCVLSAKLRVNFCGYRNSSNHRKRFDRLRVFNIFRMLTAVSNMKFKSLIFLL